MALEFSNKAEARRWARAELRSIGFEESSWFGSEATRRTIDLEEFRRASLVLLFLSMPTEIDTAPLVESCLAAGKRTAAPAIVGDEIEFKELDETWRSWPRNAFDIPTPPPDARSVQMDDIFMAETVAVVPGLLFDRHGGRLGRGRGYYDRFLSRALAALTEHQTSGRFIPVGFCMSKQIVERVPVGPGDVRLPLVVTDAETIVADMKGMRHAAFT